MHGNKLLLLLVSSASLCFLTSTASAQRYSRPYDGIDAGIDAYYYHEAQRREQIQEMLALKYLLARYRTMPADLILSWPSAPRDLWGYSYPVMGPQPIGRVQVRTGPTTWESHPVYPGDILPAPLPDEVVLEPPSTTAVSPGEVLPAPPPEHQFPREF